MNCVVNADSAEAVVDTSVIQYLHQLGRLQLLFPLFPRGVWMPDPVALELDVGRRRGISLPSIHELAEFRPCSPDLSLLQVRQLGPGERAVLCHAIQNPGITVLLDDNLGRVIAKRQGISLVGTLGILVRAKNRGEIETVAPEIRSLEQLGFRVAPAVRTTIGLLTGESLER